MSSATALAPAENALRVSCVTPVVFIIDDDICVRQSLEMQIPRAGWAVETFATAKEFLGRQRASTPSCLILDLALPDINGLDLQKCVAEDCAVMPVIFITTHADVPSAVRAMKAGAVEFLTKPFCVDTLLSAVGEALACSRAALAEQAQIRLLRCRYASLTKREKELMGLVVQGLLNKQSGGKLGISEITVKAHRGKVMRKMRANSLADLVNIAARLRLSENRRSMFQTEAVSSFSRFD
jgi:FixJ family two-component response regulator